MYIKKQNGRIYGATFTEAEKKAMGIEVRRELVKANKARENDVDAAILYTLYNRFGWGAKRLREFYDAFTEEYKKLINYYQMPNAYPWLCKEMLKRVGVDIDEWNNEREGKDGTAENNRQ